MSNSSFELISDEMSKRIVETAESIVTSQGAHVLTVRKILTTLGITNRVFYNRFHNIDDVLNVVYKNTIMKIRATLTSQLDSEKDFFEQVIDLVEKSLVISYETKMQFNHYVFENDSVSDSNYEWWTSEIKKIIEYAMERNLIKVVDSEIMSYSIWCFCRGFNADAVGRNLPKEEAIKRFRYSFSFLLEGLKNKTIK